MVLKKNIKSVAGRLLDNYAHIWRLERFKMDRELSDVILMDEVEVDKLIVDADFWKNECLKMQRRNEHLEKNLSKLTRAVIKSAKKSSHSKVS